MSTYRIGDKYKSCIQLDEYNGKWSLVAAREADNGEIYKVWIHHQGKNKTINEKASPVKIGNLPKHEMIKMLKWALSELMIDENGVIANGNEPVSETPF